VLVKSFISLCTTDQDSGLDPSILLYPALLHRMVKYLCLTFCTNVSLSKNRIEHFASVIISVPVSSLFSRSEMETLQSWDSPSLLIFFQLLYNINEATLLVPIHHLPRKKTKMANCKITINQKASGILLMDGCVLGCDSAF